jgi:hypothetical protein
MKDKVKIHKKMDSVNIPEVVTDCAQLSDQENQVPVGQINITRISPTILRFRRSTE